jgi:dTDP-4-dehydrorhamnose reductase
MRILVTGSSGLLGERILPLLVDNGHEVVSAYATRLPPAGRPINLDLMNPASISKVIEQVRPDIIIHAASVTDVDLCEERPGMAMHVNGVATGTIGVVAHTVGAYVVYVSTDYVFDGQTGNYREGDETNPINHYGRSKLQGERLLAKSGATYCVARTSVVYGWGREYRPNFALWVVGKLRSRQIARVVNDQFASPTLDFNLAEMIMDLAGKRYEGLMHLAGATRADRYSFALQIADTFGLDRGLIHPVSSDSINWKAKRPRDSSLNIQKAQSTLKIEPMKLEEALDHFRAAVSRRRKL